MIHSMPAHVKLYIRFFFWLQHKNVSQICVSLVQNNYAAELPNLLGHVFRIIAHFEVEWKLIEPSSAHIQSTNFFLYFFPNYEYNNKG